MNRNDNLIAYLKCAFDLEVEIYKTNKLIEQYEEIRENGKPKEPLKRVLPAPDKPYILTNDTLPTAPNVKLTKVTIYISLACLCFAIGGWFCLMAIPLLYFALLLIGLPFIALGVLFFKCYRKEYKNNTKLSLEYKQNIENQYNEKLKQNKKENDRKNEEYQIAYSQYLDELTLYNEETKKQLEKFLDVKSMLIVSLNNLYSQNIIYSKYRNIISIASIYEYFESGRCNELEGPNGAYNLYEGEIRTDIIIASLSKIINDLEQIKSNQYALYNQIKSSHDTIFNLLQNINDTQIITAYYTAAAAKAASADRIIIGRVW